MKLMVTLVKLSQAQKIAHTVSSLKSELAYNLMLTAASNAAERSCRAARSDPGPPERSVEPATGRASGSVPVAPRGGA